MRLSLGLVLCVSLASCGDIEVRSIRVSESVPEELQGEWTGHWQSSDGSGGGAIVLRMQDFGGTPVVSVQLDNACIEAREYQFRTFGNQLELLADGEVLFSALFGDDRTLLGTYGCDADAGTWDAAWAHALPDLVDLGGRWEGSISAFGQPLRTLVLDLDLVVRGGALVVEGSVAVPSLLMTPLPVSGLITFRHEPVFDVHSFELLLATPIGSSPTVQLFGTGDPQLRRIDTGLLQTSGDPLPLTAAWRAQWVQ